MSRADITVSIVSYNSRNVLERCLKSVIDATASITAEITVVDNASSDGSADFVTRNFPSVILIHNTENVGFGTAHNQAFRRSHGRYFLVLNPDTVIFPNAITKMLAFMERSDRAGALGCKIWWDDDRNFLFPDLRIHDLKTALLYFTPLCRFFPDNFLARAHRRSAYSVWKSSEAADVDGITGGIMLFRSDAFESAGLFDENFFLFFEEHDILRNVRKAGWRIVYLPDAEIQHFFEESVRNASVDIGRVYRDSALYYYRKHYGAAGPAYLRFLMRCSDFIMKRAVRAGGIFSRAPLELEAIRPDGNGKIIIRWEASPRAAEYVVEVSYSPDFCDRGGMFVSDDHVSLDRSVLKRLPGGSGFIRVLPHYGSGRVGRAVKTVRITADPDQ